MTKLYPVLALVSCASGAKTELPPFVPPVLNENGGIVHGLARGGPEHVYPDSVSPGLTCPEGHEQQGRACVKVYEVEQRYFCPDGYVIDETQTVCTARKRRPAKLSCPEGSIYRAGLGPKDARCEVVDILPPVPTCEIGFHLEDGFCVKLGTSGSKQVCPEGHKMTRAGCVAVSRAAPEIKCPHNFELVGKRCESWVYERALKECPPGGYALINDVCVKETKQSPSFQCPSGSFSGLGRPTVTQTEDVCYHEQILKPLHRCGNVAATTTAGGLTTGQANIAGKSSVTSKSGGLCEYMVSAAPSLICPAGYERNGEKCIRVLEESVQAVCESGYRLSEDKKECVRVFVEKADLSCPEGTLRKNGNCIVTTTSVAEPVCAKGFKLENGLCVNTTTKTPYERCPKGYKPSYRDECELIVAIAPEYICPPDHTHKNGICESNDVKALQSICDDGTHPTPDGKCTKVEAKTPKQQCPSGFILSKTGECTKTNSITPVYYCDPNSSLFSDQCETTHQTSPLAECPKGFIGADSTCQRTEIIEAKLECPRRYKLKGGLCVKA